MEFRRFRQDRLSLPAISSLSATSAGNRVRHLIPSRRVRFGVPGVQRPRACRVLFVRAKFLIRAGDWQAEIGLCADGHVVTFRHGKRTLVEVISSAARELPEGTGRPPAQAARQPNRKMRRGRRTGVSVLPASRTARAAGLSPAPRGTVDGQHTPPGGLPFRRWKSARPIPSKPDANRRTAATSLLIHAFHSFPMDLAVVKAQTLIEL